MAIRYVWDSSLQDDSDSTWNSSTLAYTTLAAALSGVTGGTDLIYMASDHSETATADFTGPTINPPIEIFSINRADDTYLKATAAQLTRTGSHLFNGAFSLFGLFTKATINITFAPDKNEHHKTQDCTFQPGANDFIYVNGSGEWFSHDDTFDCTQDTGASSSGIVGVWTSGSASVHMSNPTFINVTNRTSLVYMRGGSVEIVGSDLSQFTYLVQPIITYASSLVHFVGCILKAGVALSSSTSATLPCRIMTTLCDDTSGNNISRTEIQIPARGKIVTDTTTVRVGGATDAATNLISWGMTTLATVDTENPICTQDIVIWNRFLVSKTFTINIAHSLAALLQDDEFWMELDYMDASGNTQTARATTRWNASAPLASPANLTTNTENWSGSPTYKQEVSVTVTPGQEGPIIARLCYAKTSGGSVYVDPVLVTS